MDMIAKNKVRRTEAAPRSLKTASAAAAAKALLGDPEITVEEVARRLKVSPATLYRHLPGGRGAVMAGAA